MTTGHAFELTRTFTPRHLRCLGRFYLSKRVRQSLVRTSYPWRDKAFSRTLPPTFLFLQYSIFKEQTSQTRCRGPLRFWLRGRSSVAHAALLNFAKGRLRSKLLRRQRRAALVGEAYIVGHQQELSTAKIALFSISRGDPRRGQKW